MRLSKKNKLVVIGCVFAVTASLTLVAGCSPQQSQPTDAQPSANEKGSSDAYTATYDLETPLVTALEDGTLVQLTPDGKTNTQILKGDARGCYACHGNLNELMLMMYPEHNPSYGLDGVLPTISQCLGCHNNASYAGNLGSYLHGIHNVGEEANSVDCYSCHDTSVEGGMMLWDETKHTVFEGITQVENVAGTFAFDEDYTVGADEMPNAQWMGNYYDELRFDNERNNVPLDEEMFDTWEISITGEVAEEKTWKLPELIEAAETAGVVTKTPLVAQCTINPLGGEAIAQVEVTGIPLDWLLEQVDVNDEAVGFTWYSPDGEKAGYRGQNFDELEGHESYLVYELNGERLSWTNGYPAMLWIGGYCADHISKNFSELRISTDDFALGTEGVPAGGDGTLKGSGKPNLGFLNTPEGKIVLDSEPYTFEGWANAFDLNIAALEFSMDGGQTWTRCETPDTNNNRWVHWTYEWTPPAADADTAYVLQARAIADDGRVTPTPIEVMVNVKSEMPSVSEVE